MTKMDLSQGLYFLTPTREAMYTPHDGTREAMYTPHDGTREAYRVYTTVLMVLGGIPGYKPLFSWSWEAYLGIYSRVHT